METSEIVRLLRGRKVGQNKWQARCPVSRNHSHGDRNPSLSIAVGKNPGFTVLKCQAGCSVHDIVAALGWRLRDLCGVGEITDAMRQRAKDEDRLVLLVRRHGLAIMAQVVLPQESRYWAAVERNIAVEIEAMRVKLFPEEAALIRRNERVHRIISEYGFDELWECLPCPQV